MRSTLWWLSLIFGTLSVLMLIKNGFEVSFVSSIELILTFSDQLIQVLLGWAEPSIRSVLAEISTWFGWQLQLFPHWREVFILMLLYFSNGARTMWVNGLRWTALFEIALGTLLSLLASVGVGLLPVHASQSTAIDLVLIAIPTIAMILYQVCMGAWVATHFARWRDSSQWWAHFLENASYTSAPYVIGGLFAMSLCLASDSIPLLREVSNRGLVLLCALTIALALHTLWVGARIGLRSRRADQTAWDAIVANRNTIPLGLGILGTMTGAAVFVLANAGLQLLGVK